MTMFQFRQVTHKFTKKC